MTVNLYLLGEMRIEFSGHPLRLPTKGVELASFLAVQPNAKSSRRSAALALWPDREEARALSNLSTLLWRIKGLIDPIGTKFLSWDASHLWLESKAIWVDCWELERISKTLVEGRDPTPLLDTLLDSYQGELGGRDAAFDWITEFREYFRVLYLETLARAGRILQARGNIGGSRRVFEKIFQIDPANETSAQELMKIYARDGNGDRINYVYSTLISHLRRDLGVEPTQETVGLYREIRGRMTTPVDTGILRSFPSSFVVRNECDPLRSIFLTSQTNLTRAIGIRGDWGLGKTTLLKRLLVERARWGSSHLIRLPELAEEVGPYQCLYRLSLSLAGRSEDSPFLNRGRDSLSGLPSIEGSMMSWLHSVIRQETTKGTSLIMFDNIQSSDIYSLRIIRELRKELDGRPLIFVLTWSKEDCSEDILNFLGEQGFFDEIISLRPFSPAEVSELLGSWGLERLGSPLIDRLTEITGGNPRLLETATRQLSGLPLRLFRRTWELGLMRVLQEIQGGSYIGRIARRLALLPREACTLLEAACVLGHRESLASLVEVSRLPRRSVLHLLGQLSQRGLIGVEGTDYHFSSLFSRQVILQWIPTDSRIEWHRRTIPLVRARPDAAAKTLAWHLEGAELPMEAGTQWEAIGDRAASGGQQREAEAAYTKALALVSTAKPSRLRVTRLLRKRAAARRVLGRLEEAEADLDRAILLSGEVRSAKERFEGELQRAWVYLWQGKFAETRRSITRLMRLADVIGDQRQRTRIGELTYYLLYRKGQLFQARNGFRRLAEEINPRSDVATLERLWTSIGRVELALGLNEEALRSLERAERWDSGQAYQRGLRHLIRGIIHYAEGFAQEAKIQLGLATQTFCQMGDLAAEALARAFLASACAMSGDLREALKQACRGLPFMAGKGDKRWTLVVTTNLVSTLLYALPNFRLARSMLMKALAVPAAEEAHGNVYSLLIRLALEQGRVEFALQLASEARLAGALYSRDPTHRAFRMLALGKVCLATSADSPAVEYFRKAIRLFKRTGDHYGYVDALTSLALAFRSGDRSKALKASNEAITLLEAKGLAHPRPQEAYWNHYQILGDPQNPEAQHALTTAYALVERLSKGLGRRGRERFLRFPLNAAIVETWNKVYGPGSELPRGQAPPRPASRSRVVLVALPAQEERGRVARSAFVEVYWTVDSGETDERIRQVKGLVGLRRARILRLLAEADAQGARPREQDLARVLGVSVRTIRADIAALRAQSALPPARTVPRSTRRRRPPASAPVGSDDLPAVLPAANEMTV